MPKFADVILPLPLKRHFTYQVAQDQENILKPGFRVAVPFGKSKVYTGIIAKLHEKQPLQYDAKLIEEVLDQEALVTEKQLKFWSWIADYYMCAEGEVMKAALPSAFLLESETIIELNKESTINENELSDDEFLIVEALGNQSLLKINEVIQLLEKKTVLPIINSLVAKKAIIVNQELYKQYKPKLVNYIRLTNQFSDPENLKNALDELDKAPQQKNAVLSLFSIEARTKKPIKKKQLAKESGVSSSTINTLVDKGFLEVYQLQQERIATEASTVDTSLKLSEEQATALKQIQQNFSNQKITLLHGVTSSGKTKIYVELIQQAIEQDKQVLYLLPEIALTTQLIKRLRNYFGNRILVYHSKYSVNERVEIYKNVFENTERKIVIGARSSIFLPFQDLGLVIIDESHESSFKQYNPAPRYQARDAAVVLANYFNSQVLLGSATPSLESFYNTQQRKYELVSLTKRYGNVIPPKIELVDIKEKYRKKKMTGHFSDTLLKEMEETLAEGKQVILFQNRRGYSPILECTTCGHSPQCPNCDVSLTYHQHNNSLRCHYCGYHMSMQKECIACSSTELTTKGFGTEQIETELKAIFPNYHSRRMDLDTTRGKYGYEKLITAFEQQEIDILVGTQMVTKGLDFKNVNLVGVMNADSLLNFPDFRAHERSFQLLTQVAGRAGRYKTQGKVLIQTYNPYHKILQQVSTYSYDEMYDEQIEERYQFKFPPYYKLIRLTFKSKDFEAVNQAAAWVETPLKQTFKNLVLGPVFPPVARIRNEYHKNITLKMAPKQSIAKTKEYLKQIFKSYDAIPQFRKVRILIDVNPY